MIPAKDGALLGKQVRQSGTSFYWAMRLLPSDRRQSMYALYAYCRTLDDIADAPDSGPSGAHALAMWRKRVGGLYGDGPAPDDALTRALAEAVRRHDLPRDELEAVIEGMEMDVAGEMVAPSTANLALYCRKVAGAVGLLSMPIFGAGGDGDSKRFALVLGEALQLTNILRDLNEDAALGRLYLPEEMLSQAGITARTPFEVLADPRLPAACASLAQVAQERYAEAQELLEHLPDPGALRPAAIMMGLYRHLFRRIGARGWGAVGTGRIRLTSIEKLAIALRCGVLGR